MFVVSGPGPATTRATTAADINALLAAVSGQKTKFASKAVRASRGRNTTASSRPAPIPTSRFQGVVL